MSKTKFTPQCIDTEDLLKKAEELPVIQGTSSSIDPVELQNDSNDVYRFIATFNLKGGQEVIKKTVLFSIYRAWSYNPIYKKDFLKYCDNVFPKNHRNTFYHINEYPVKLAYKAYQSYKKDGITLTDKHWNVKIQDFINYHSLTKQDYWIEASILYFLYDKYNNTMGYTHYKEALLREGFERYISIFFPKKNTEKGVYYNVSKNIEVFFQPGQLERMRKTHAKEFVEEKKAKETEKRKPKKSAKSPRSRSKIQSKN